MNTLEQTKIFISCANTTVGYSIYEELRTDHINDLNPNYFTATRSYKAAGPIPDTIQREIDPTETTVLIESLLESDVIVYDLMHSPHDEIEFALKVISNCDYTKPKYFILISSVLVWSETKPKKSSVKASEEQYHESEYTKRVPHPIYHNYFALENICLSKNNPSKNLFTYVICAGYPYGRGEDIFANYFYRARNQLDLNYTGNGNNWIPTIHVEDLAQFVHLIIDKRPFQKYIYAIDHSTESTLLNILTAISGKYGNKKVERLPLAEAIFQNLEKFTLNIKLMPSNVFNLPGEIEGDHLKWGETPTQQYFRSLTKKFVFEWKSRDGLVKNIEKIIQEHINFRGLKALKLVIIGPAAAGKSTFAKELSRDYNLNHLTVPVVLQELKQTQSDLSAEVNSFCEQEKKRLLEENLMIVEEIKKKKRKGPEPETDPEKIVPRLPDNMMARVFKWRISRTDCLNQGYVLDGYPKTYLEAIELFSDENNTLNKKIAPDLIFNLESSDEFLKNRVKEKPEEEIQGTHYTEDGMNRRLANFKKNKESSDPLVFFSENSINIDHFDVEKTPHKDAVNMMQEVIQNKGNYRKIQKKSGIQTLLDELNTNDPEETKKQELEMIQQRKKQEEINRKRIQESKEKEISILNQKSQSLRQYLADLVVPFLSAGIIETYKKEPENPIDYLADYLINNAKNLKIKNYEFVQEIPKKKKN